MNIVRIAVFTKRLDLEKGFQHYRGRVASLEQVYAQVVAEGGLAGWGEVRGNLEYFSGETQRGIVAALQVLVPRVLGRDARDIEAILADLDTGVMGNAPAKAVIDIALHDLGARAAGVPLYRWLGGRRQPELLASECIFYGTVAEAATQAARYVNEGFRILKVRVGMTPFSLDVDRLTAIREAVGPEIVLAVDANQAWSAPEAIQKIRRLERFDLTCVEQPVAARDFFGLAQVARNVETPIMVDESLISLEDAITLIRLEAAGVFHIKLVKAGGIARARRLIALAEAAHIPYVIGQMNEGLLATMAAAHCGAASTPKYAELYGADGIVNDPVAGTVHRNGKVVVPEAPGIGLEVREAELTREFEVA